MKQCNKCKQTKEFANFYANKRMKDGLNTFCIDCHKADNIARKAIKRLDDAFKQKEAEYKKQYRASDSGKHASYMKVWHEKNANAQAEYRKEYRDKNKSYFIEYNKSHKSEKLAATRKRQIAKLKRTPAWLSMDDNWIIKEIYSLAESRTKAHGFTWEVDHIIPLQGKLVSGLHVPENLQVIPSMQNRSKANKHEVF